MGKASRRKKLRRDPAALLSVDGLAAIEKLTGGTENIAVRTNLPQEEKISHALATLLEPLMADSRSLEERQGLLDAVVTAWNLSLLPTSAQPEAMEEVAEQLAAGDPEVRMGVLSDLQRLVQDKQAIFPHDRRYVVQWNGALTHGDFRVTAAAVYLPASQ